MFALIDTDTCSSCCEELIAEFVTLQDAGKYLVENYDHGNLLNGDMDYVVLKDTNGQHMSASDVLHALGYNADRLESCKIEKHRAAMEWLNLMIM